ncbi:MAG TPA: hypothetical protein DCZ72_04130, partial [Armatimonadetes bacterium]|nr:hypothetical protein [Armatimonadota bacterium]
AATLEAAGRRAGLATAWLDLAAARKALGQPARELVEQAAALAEELGLARVIARARQFLADSG